MAGRRALLLVLIGAAAAPSSAAAADGFSIAPSRIEAEVRHGDRLPGVVVTNGSRETVDVEIATVVAGQELSGLPSFAVTRRSVREGRRIVRVTPGRFRLRAGASRELHPRVLGGPTNGRASYVVIAATATPRGEKSGSAVVAPRVRLTANLLLRHRGGRAVPHITGLRAAQGPGLEGGRRSLAFFARLANSGTTHFKPKLRLVVRDSAGRAVVARNIASGAVLPGFERELGRETRSQLVAGDYTARVRARLGDWAGSAETAFSLSDVNELPTPDLKIATLPVPAPDAGDDFGTGLAVVNRGTGAGEATGEAIVTVAGAEEALARVPIEIGEVQPGETAEVRVGLPGLPSRPLMLTVRLRDGDRELDTRTVGFTPGTRPPFRDRALDWAAAHVPLLLALFAGSLVMVVLGAASLVRRERRRAVAGAQPLPR